MTIVKPLRLLLVLMIAMVVAGRAPGAWACSCVGGQSEADFTRQSDVVFTGRVTAMRDPNASNEIRSSGDLVRWTFVVEKIHKGKTDGTLVSEREGATCGYLFTVGGRYKVFAFDDTNKGALYTNLCSGTREIEGAAAAPTGDTPPGVTLPADSGPGLPLALAGILALAGAGALTWHLHARKAEQPPEQ